MPRIPAAIKEAARYAVYGARTEPNVMTCTQEPATGAGANLIAATVAEHMINLAVTGNSAMLTTSIGVDPAMGPDEAVLVSHGADGRIRDAVRLRPSPDAADALAMTMASTVNLAPGAINFVETENLSAGEIMRRMTEARAEIEGRLEMERLVQRQIHHYEMTREEERQRAMHQRRGNTHEMEVRIDHRHDRHMLQVEVSVPAYHVGEMVDPRRMAEDPHAFMQEMVESISRTFYERFRRDLGEATARAMMEHNHAQYGGRGAMAEGIAHMRDMYDPFRRRGANIPVTDEPIKALADLPKELTFNGLTATLIDTTAKVKAEGAEMSHCLGEAYIARIARGDYIAYHIGGMHKPKSGLTLGIKRVPAGTRQGSMSGGYYACEVDGWAFDQIKGKKNDTTYCKTPEVLAFCNYIETTINKRSQNNDTKAKPVRAIADSIGTEQATAHNV